MIVRTDPQQLGALPLIPIAIAGGMAVGTGAGAVTALKTKESYESGWLNLLLQQIGLKEKDEATLPRSTAPAAQPPVAPQTRYGMINWSPDLMGEATAQRDRQYRMDMELIRDFASGSAPRPDPPDNRLNAVLIVAALGVIALLLLTRR